MHSLKSIYYHVDPVVYLCQGFMPTAHALHQDLRFHGLLNLDTIYIYSKSIISPYSRISSKVSATFPTLPSSSQYSHIEKSSSKSKYTHAPSAKEPNSKPLFTHSESIYPSESCLSTILGICCFSLFISTRYFK